MPEALAASFINKEIYGIYKAITEVCGEDGWKIMWRAGELVFDQVEKELEFASREPMHRVCRGFCARCRASCSRTPSAGRS